MNLSKYIADLLVKNNCVIVPNFGGFIANYKSAVIDEVKHKIYPPSKSVLFNKNLISNDGLLANYVANEINKTYSDSLSLIDDVAQNWKTQLKKGERITIGEVGFLYQTDNVIQFEQDREFNLYLGAYGLSSVNFVPFKKGGNTTTVIVNENVFELTEGIEIRPVTHVEDKIYIKETKVVDLPKVKSKSNRWKYIAAACFLPALFYSYWIPMETYYLDSGNIQMADLSPMHKKADKIYNTRIEKADMSIVKDDLTLLDKMKLSSSAVAYYNYQLTDELYIPIKFETKKVDKTKVVSTHDVTKTVAEVNTDNNIFLIAGCFGSEKNAKNLVQDLISKGYKSEILDKSNGLFRVAVQSFSNKKRAIDFKSELESNSISTWVLTK